MGQYVIHVGTLTNLIRGNCIGDDGEKLLICGDMNMLGLKLKV